MSLNKRLMSSAPPPFVASENFSIVTYAGNSASDSSGTTQTITGVGFKSDFIWIKRRDGAEAHFLQDSTRGSTKTIYSQGNNAEFDETDAVTSFDNDGFTLGDYNGTNKLGETFVAFCWKANGGTTSTNTDGATIDSTVQVNADAGFSIVKWTGTANAAHTVGHGLGVAPNVVISKNLDAADTWQVYHSGAGASLKYGAHLDSTAAFNSSAGTNGGWDTPTSTVLKFSNGSSSIDNLNTNSEDYIAYCFADIAGFSKFGGYIGNGTTLIVETGFEPSWILIKSTVGADNWRLYDTTRGINAGFLEPNRTDGEDTSNAPNINILSNGFEINAGGTTVGNNVDGNLYTYMAFASDPDTTAPTLASSFGIQTYTGTGAAQSITGFGFKPGLVWWKNRSGTNSHALADIVRGANKYIHSDGNQAQNVSNGTSEDCISFDADGFSVGTVQNAGSINTSGGSIVAWAWKADDNEPTIFGGPAAAAYKFEDNANDVSGTYNGTASNISYSSSGQFNKAAEFNGSNSGIDIGNIGIGGAAARTISAWVYVDNLDSAQTIFQYGSNSNGQRFGFAIDTAGKVYVEFYNRDAITSSAQISANTWYHLVATYNGGAIEGVSNTQIYVDGVAVAMSNSGAQTGSANTGNSNYGIGYDRLNTRQYFDGKIDQLRIYRGVASSVDIAALYAETTSDNDDLALGGSPEILVSANSNAGFSIVKYEGRTEAQKIPHGLSAAPNMIIAKNISDSSTSWTVFHSSLGAGKILRLENAEDEITNDVFWGGTSNAPNATTFTVGVQNDTNAEDGSLNKIIAYCFHDVSGYQKFGSYTGTGSTGNAVTVGFKPDFVMVKATGEDEPWFILDSRRDTSNPRDNRIMPDSNAAEDDGSVHTMDFNSDNFTLDGTVGNGTNGNNKNYIYWAVKINSIQIDYLVIAGGGGGGGNNRAGGGGAGGYIYKTGAGITAGTVYTITVGAGGGAATNGSDSVFGSVTAIGGGRGGSCDGSGSASTGGSGGGGGGLGTTTEAGAAGTSGQGNAGGHGYYTGATQRNGGGGGGSAATGGNASANTSGDGGNGTASSITGSSVTRAGGGGGGDQLSGEGSGGSGGGGNGGRDTSINATAGTANTGSGGGGGGGTGGAGGSGIVILRLLTSDYTGTTTGSPGVTTDGDYTVLQYTSDGTYTA